MMVRMPLFFWPIAVLQILFMVEVKMRRIQSRFFDDKVASRILNIYRTLSFISRNLQVICRLPNGIY